MSVHAPRSPAHRASSWMVTMWLTTSSSDGSGFGTRRVRLGRRGGWVEARPQRTIDQKRAHCVLPPRWMAVGSHHGTSISTHSHRPMSWRWGGDPVTSRSTPSGTIATCSRFGVPATTSSAVTSRSAPVEWHALTVFAGRLSTHVRRQDAEQQVLDFGLTSLAERWTLIETASGEEQVVCIQEVDPTTVTLVLGYYSLPGVPRRPSPVTTWPRGGGTFVVPLDKSNTSSICWVDGWCCRHARRGARCRRRCRARRAV